MRAAVCDFHRRYPPPCPDAVEWCRDCEQIAWLAALEVCHNNLSSENGRLLALQIYKCVMNALRREWRRERRWYSSTVSMAQPTDDGESEEFDLADTATSFQVVGLIERIACEQVLERLLPMLDHRDCAILTGLSEGKTETQIAREIGVSQSAIAHRLRRIRRLAEQYWGG
ncbi:MAG: hypothetical protein ACP5RN_01335 [Armatimonadota bacterium]